MKTKRIISDIASLMLMAIAFGSCQKKDDVQKGDGEAQRDVIVTTFYAHSGENDSNTKTSRKENGDLLWSPEDEIMVFCGEASGKFVAQNKESAEIATFVGTFDKVVSSSDVSANGVLAFYPYSDDIRREGDAVVFTLPSSQSAIAGTFDDDLYPVIARSDNTDLSFYNICGGAKFTVSQDGIKTVTIRGNDSEPLAGKLSVTFDENGVPTVDVIEAEKKIVVTAPDGGTFEVGKEYYIVSIPQYLKNGFTLIYNEGLSVNNEFKVRKAISINRSKFGTLMYLDKDMDIIAMTEPIKFKDSIIEKLCVAKWDTDGDGYLSYAEAAAVKTLGSVFKNNTSIESFSELEYFSGLSEICSGAFMGCSHLYNAIVPKGVTSIGPDAFMGCNELYVVSIPSSVTSIGESAFYECNNIGIVLIPDVASWCEVEIEDANANPLRNARQCILNDVLNPTDLVIPEGVTSIGTWAFLGCNWLKSVTIPSSVTTIGSKAFWGCTGLESVTISEGVTSIGEDAFRYCDSLSALFVSDVPSWFEIDFKNVYSNPLFYEQCLFNGAPKPADFVIPEGTTSIGTYAFHGCNWLKSVTIPSSVTTIDSNAFSSCSGLESVTISEGVTSIDSYAFSDCTGLTDLIIPKSVKSIGDYSFSGCTSLLNITIVEGGGTTMIGEYAFSGCNATQIVKIPQSVVSIGAQAFLGCTGKLTVYCDIPSARFNSSPFMGSNFSEVEIGEGVTKIGDNAFNQCAMKSITMSNTVTSIGDEAFWGCDGLTNVIIPDSVTSIGVSAFEECSSLTSVVLSEGITSIPKSVFAGCPITDVNIPNNVTEVGENAFYRCDMTCVIIPENVTYLHSYAFGWCENLKTVFLKAETPPIVSKYTFYPRSDGFIIYVPYSSLDSYLDSWGVFSAYLRGYAF